MGQNQVLGRQGEEAAVRFLEEKGFSILERNYRAGRSEVDIIAMDGKMLVICEVKTRNWGTQNDGAASVGNKKHKTLMRAAIRYMEDKKLQCELRFDLLCVTHYRGEWSVEHFEDVFLPY
ncbi:MAG: YraN family protein [Chitinophagales bacterium]